MTYQLSNKLSTDFLAVSLNWAFSDLRSQLPVKKHSISRLTVKIGTNCQISVSKSLCRRCYWNKDLSATSSAWYCTGEVRVWRFFIKRTNSYKLVQPSVKEHAERWSSPEGRKNTHRNGQKFTGVFLELGTLVTDWNHHCLPFPHKSQLKFLFESRTLKKTLGKEEQKQLLESARTKGSLVSLPPSQRDTFISKSRW